MVCDGFRCNSLQSYVDYDDPMGAIINVLLPPPHIVGFVSRAMWLGFTTRWKPCEMDLQPLYNPALFYCFNYFPIE